MAKWTAVIAVVLGSLAAIQTLTPPPLIAELKEIHPAATQDPRAPASRVEGPTSVDDSPVERAVPCAATQIERVDAHAKQIRFTGEFCNSTKGGPNTTGVPQTRIVNRTNGFSATAFFPPQGGYTTDYISLAPGENRIEVSHAWPSGARTTMEIAIVRSN